MRFPVVLTLFVSLMVCRLPATEKALFSSEIIFPLEHWHNHASSIVEAPNGDLWVCWFHGSGERKADDVKIEGSRKRRGASAWAPRFTMADTPEYPDTNPTLFIDPRGRLWLLWPTILANEWHTALMKYRISSDYRHEGPPPSPRGSSSIPPGVLVHGRRDPRPSPPRCSSMLATWSSIALGCSPSPPRVLVHAPCYRLDPPWSAWAGSG